MRQIAGKLFGWRIQAVAYEPLADIAPGIAKALDEHGIPVVIAGDHHALDTSLPDETSVLALGAVFEPFALELFAWAKRRGAPVVAIEEVAQLGLNDNDISNYDAPFDRLFVASPDEQERFLALGYTQDMLRASGLPAYERIAPYSAAEEVAALERLDIRDGRKPIVYTTTPLRSRRAIHNKDTPAFRDAMLQALALAGKATQRRILVKLHPNEDPDAERAFITQRIPGAIVIGRELTMDTLFAAAAVVVNRGNSQTCLEAVLRGVPVVVAACGLRTLFHDTGVARIVESTDALANSVAEAIPEGSPPLAEFRARHCLVPDGGVSAFIAGELQALATQRIPASPAAWRWLLRSMLFMGRHARALALLRDAPIDDPWTDCVRLALDAHLSGQRETAMEHWHRCLALDPTWFYPDYELAHGRLAAGLNDSAIAHARRAIALHPPFHGLWHELPMRVVIMTALRGLGRDIEAGAELAALAQRGLVDVVPELLIEKSALAIRQPQGLRLALEAVECALSELVRFPIDPDLDGELRERAAIQLRKVAAWAEQIPNHAIAAASHARLASMFANDAWEHFAWARATLGDGKWVRGLRMLAAMSGIPEAPQTVAVRALPSPMAAELLALWPETPGVRSRPWTLLLRTGAWCLHNLRASGGRDWPHALAFTILIGLFVPRHYLHRLLSPKPVIP
jgi:tetratricopeptide (TPR) repeat protein